MSESPIQTILQQRDARPVSGEHLEVLGKKAASDWVTGKTASLHEAIVETVRGERLSPEQVCRVVEFCNGDAYLQEFRKESSHRVVHFDCGPADPAQVLQDLNDGGGGSVYDKGDGDYSRSPRSIRKEASTSMANRLARMRARRGETEEEFEAGIAKSAAAQEPGVPGLPKLTKMPELPKAASDDRYETQLWEMLGGGTETPMKLAEPLRPLLDVRAKLAGAADQVGSDLDRLEVDFMHASDELYQQVKQAALSGASLSDVVTAWSVVSTEPSFVKAAFDMLTPRLRSGGVFHSYDEIGASLTKKASIGEVNMDHPMVPAYRDFCETLNKLAALRELRAEFKQGAEQAESLLKRAASGGLVGAAKRGVQAASSGIDSASPVLARMLVGQQDAQHLAPTLSKGLKATGLVGGVLAGNAALQSVTDRPLVRSGLSATKSLVPGTQEYQQRRYNNMMGQ